MNVVNWGQTFLTIAWFWAILMTGAALWAEHTHNVRWRETARGGAVGLFILLTAAVLALEYALVTKNFQVDAVYQHTNLTLPMGFRVGALWGGDSGSILFWSWLLSLYAAFAAWWDAERYPRLTNLALAGLGGLLFFFVGVDRWTTNPFRLMPGHPLNGAGLDPLLQNLVMLIHPPAMYTGLVGMALPATYVLAAIWLRQGGAEWIPLVRRRMMFSWMLLSAALVLGGMWSYMVLGWGGYWEWDPVENAALLPWLTGTVFLHLMQLDMHQRRIRLWTIASAISTFLLTLLGTYITRSGVLQNSVHSFVGSGVGPYFMGLFWGSLIVSGIIIAARWDTLRAVHRRGRETPVEGQGWTRESLTQWLAVIFTLLTLIVLFGTLYPVFSKWLFGTSIVFNVSFFNTFSTPAFLFVLLLLVLVPFYGWQGAQGRMSRLSVPVVMGLVFGIFGAVSGKGGSPAGLIAFGLGGAALGSLVLDVGHLVWPRELQSGGWLVAVQRNLIRQRRRIGAHIAHLAFVLVVLGVTGSHLGSISQTVRLAPGSSVSLGGYTVTNLGLDHKTTPQGQLVQARLAVVGNGPPFTITSGDMFFAGAAQPVADIAIHGTLMQDLYMVLEGWTGTGAHQVAVFDMMVNPMVSWIWIGMYILIAGSLLVLSRGDPHRQDPADAVWDLATPWSVKG